MMDVMGGRKVVISMMFMDEQRGVPYYYLAGYGDQFKWQPWMFQEFYQE